MDLPLNSLTTTRRVELICNQSISARVTNPKLGPRARQRTGQNELPSASFSAAETVAVPVFAFLAGSTALPSPSLPSSRRERLKDLKPGMVLCCTVLVLYCACAVGPATEAVVSWRGAALLNGVCAHARIGSGLLLQWLDDGLIKADGRYEARRGCFGCQTREITRRTCGLVMTR